MTGEVPVPYDPEEDEQEDGRSGPVVSERSRSVALILGLLGGWAGLHRFYTGRTESGIYMAITLGGLGIWWLYDMVMIVAGEFTDSEGRVVRRWDSQQPAAVGSSQDVARLESEIAQMQTQLAELAERVDFTERMLAQERERRQLKG